MIQELQKCQKCNLCFNQKPLLDILKENCQIFWVGLSAKRITREHLKDYIKGIEKIINNLAS